MYQVLEDAGFDVDVVEARFRELEAAYLTFCRDEEFAQLRRGARG
jgi:hypothetical protein